MFNWRQLLTLLAVGFSLQIADGATCPGTVQVKGHGPVSIVPTGWTDPSGGAPVDVPNDHTLAPHQGARAYFADTCTAGVYSNSQYSAINFLNKTFRFTTDLTGAGCGCNAALYLVSMRQNTQPSKCNDYYCDANHVCGVSCPEIDIMEANQMSWHSTLHSAHDHNGKGSGYGGGDSYDGPRDWDNIQYAPGGTCIDTATPFDVAVSFPVDAQGTLLAMVVTLTQQGKSCPLHAAVSGYAGMAELSQALAAGMTPTISYWSSDEMLWMDGKGADGKGPCATDNAAACSGTVSFSNFVLEAGAQVPAAIAAKIGIPAVLQPAAATLPPLMPPTLPPTLPPKPADATCPGEIQVGGIGAISIIPTGWKSPKMVPIGLPDTKTLTPRMGARGYFADKCTAGVYNNEQYMALNLLGKTLHFTTSLSGAGCGCNAAFYLVSMRQNPLPSDCFDYYCDANNVCGVSCPEIDIMEANQYAWHSTLHSAHDHNGQGKGYGGGSNFNGPRDWSGSQYGRGGSCIDTDKPFDVAVSFPTDAQGNLQAMEAMLTQTGKSCPLSVRIDGYPGMAQLSAALKEGMTPVMSYWSSDDMLWMDGKGSDGQGPCAQDNAAACSDSVSFSDFSVTEIGSKPGEQQLQQPPTTTIPAAPVFPQGKGGAARCPGDLSVLGFGDASIIPTGWPGDNLPIDVLQGSQLVTHMGARGYFASTCTAGTYSNEQYLALNLLGKTLRFTTDVSGAGCGCNAAFYLGSMRQNDKPGTCYDYYCDANKVCGEACAEIDIMEANQYAWHSTLHTSEDHSGLGGGYGGGSNFNGPRDFSGAQYAPGGSCIDTNMPFEVDVSFPVDSQGALQAMDVTLSQHGKSCPLSIHVTGYPGMAELSQALADGMTPVFSYWKADDMLWLDGKGSDGQGPCAVDDAGSCGKAVRFGGFSIREIGAPVPTTTSTTGAAGSEAGAAAVLSEAASDILDAVLRRQEATCPGSIDMVGHGKVALVPTGWHTGGAAPLAVQGTSTVQPHMGTRAYFAEECTPGKYDSSKYIALKLLKKTLSFTVDLSGVGCGCNVAFYLVAMCENPKPSESLDFYCDADSISGVACDEIDIMEANQFAWHTTLHVANDHEGASVGYGGGASSNGPRTWGSSQYGPGGVCIDTTKPFEVHVSFPTNSQGQLEALQLHLRQDGRECPSASISEYSGLARLSAALAVGMTPVISYWGSDKMLWLDGRGSDKLGPCDEDKPNECPQKAKLSNFSVSPLNGKAGKPSAGAPSVGAPPAGAPLATCPGSFDLPGHGSVSIVPTGWKTPKGGAKFEVQEGGKLVPTMGARAYFANKCTAGAYDHRQYLALNLLAKTMRFTVDLTEAGCGCNAAFYLTSMKQNAQASDCFDYYCDANKVCGVSCAEIDIMEANQFAWHSTLHTAHDHNGVGKGYGGGSNFNGPRDWGSQQYGPGSSCIDTAKPFNVAVSFPVDTAGALQAMEITLSQHGHTCQVSASVDSYFGMTELSEALRQGMTPIVSYWSSDDMLWMDGKGSDGQGPCAQDNAGACSDSVKFYGFAVEDMDKQGEGAAAESPAPLPATLPPAPLPVIEPTDSPVTVATPSPTPAQVATTPAAPAAPAEKCPGGFKMPGYGPISIVPTGWKTPKGGAAFDVSDDGKLVAHMGARAYFADKCTDGVYDHRQYLALNLLGKKIQFTVNLNGAGCGCNVAFYLTSMKQNSQPSDCFDYYCDANNVCGQSCAEIDIMEANQFAWHSTLHTSQDHNGLGKGYGGGDSFNGPRDWGSAQYGPGSSCIDTTKPFQVVVGFPTDATGSMQAMQVELSQTGHTCKVSASVDGYAGMGELTQALKAGMTPIASYWSSNAMLWMDGKGSDGMGPCGRDDADACAASVKLSDFSVMDINAVAPPVDVGGGQTPAPTPAPAPVEKCPGGTTLRNYGPVSIVPTGWKTPKGGAAFKVEGDTLIPQMGARAYFAEKCTAGEYDNKQYMALNFLGSTLHFTVDMPKAGCGCNVAFYLVSMRHNSKPSTCHDYYCDANKVCGVPCAEIDIMEANQFSWHSTLHTAHDRNGVAGGYGGGGKTYSGPRDWKASQYGPDSECIDTSRPFNVAVSFPTDSRGTLEAMEVKLTQEGHACSVSTRVGSYKGMAELSDALSVGMTPVVSYWSADDMLWMDGKGSDGLGPCVKDDADSCPASVKLSNFSVETLARKPGSDASSKGKDAFELLMEAATLISTAASKATPTPAPTPAPANPAPNVQTSVPGPEPLPQGEIASVPAVQPPAEQPPAVQPPAVQPPAVQPPAVQPPAVQPLPPSGGGVIQVLPGETQCAGAFQQCGGQNFPGPLCCQAGCTCQAHGDFFSQCTPSDYSGKCNPIAQAPQGEFMQNKQSRNHAIVFTHPDYKTHRRIAFCVFLVAALLTAVAFGYQCGLTHNRQLQSEEGHRHMLQGSPNTTRVEMFDGQDLHSPGVRHRSPRKSRRPIGGLQLDQVSPGGRFV